MTSLICTQCSRGAHLSCRRPECQCPCRQQLPPVLHEIAADLDQPTEAEEGAA